MVGSTPCSTAPRILKTSPASQMTMKTILKPSAELRLKFSTIWGEKTTTQQAILMLPQMPLRASMSACIAKLDTNGQSRIQMAPFYQAVACNASIQSADSVILLVQMRTPQPVFLGILESMTVRARLVDRVEIPWSRDQRGKRLALLVTCTCTVDD